MWTPPTDPSSGALSFPYPSGAWSADGRFAYLVVDGRVQVYEPRTGELFPLAVDAVEGIRSLTIRPPE